MWDFFDRFLGKPETYNLRDGIEEGDEIAVCKCKFYDNCMNFFLYILNTIVGSISLIVDMILDTFRSFLQHPLSKSNVDVFLLRSRPLVDVGKIYSSLPNSTPKEIIRTSVGIP